MANFVKSFNALKDELQNNEILLNAFKNDPIEAIKKVEPINPLDHDVWIYRIIVGSISLALLLIIIGTIILFTYGIFKDDKSVPTIFTAIASAAIGALAGLLAPSPRSQK